MASWKVIQVPVQRLVRLSDAILPLMPALIPPLMSALAYALVPAPKPVPTPAATLVRYVGSIGLTCAQMRA